MIELQQYAKKNKPNLHILSKLQEEMKRLAEERVSIGRGRYQAVSPYGNCSWGVGGSGSCPIGTHHWQCPGTWKAIQIRFAFPLSFSIRDTYAKSLFYVIKLESWQPWLDRGCEGPSLFTLTPELAVLRVGRVHWPALCPLPILRVLVGDRLPSWASSSCSP